MSLKAKLEAVIYAAEEPVTLAQLAALFAEEVLPGLDEAAPQEPPRLVPRLAGAGETGEAGEAEQIGLAALPPEGEAAPPVEETPAEEAQVAEAAETSAGERDEKK